MEAGACGAIQGAKKAKITKTTTSTTPMAASGLWRALTATRRRSEMAAADIDQDATTISQVGTSGNGESFQICADRDDQAGSRRRPRSLIGPTNFSLPAFFCIRSLKRLSAMISRRATCTASVRELRTEHFRSLAGKVGIQSN